MAGRVVREQTLYTVNPYGDDDYGDDSGMYVPRGHAVIYLGEEGRGGYGSPLPPPPSVPIRRRSMSVDYSAGVGGAYSPRATYMRPYAYHRPLPPPPPYIPSYVSSSSVPYEPTETSSDLSKDYRKYQTSSPGIYTLAAGATPVVGGRDFSSTYSSSRYRDLDTDRTPSSVHYKTTVDSPLTAGGHYRQYHTGPSSISASAGETNDKIKPLPSYGAYRVPSITAGGYGSRYSRPSRAASVSRYTDIEHEIDHPHVSRYSAYPRVSYKTISSPGGGVGDFTYVIPAEDVSGLANVDKGLLEKKIHDLRHDGKSITALEDYLRRNRLQFPQDTTLMQSLSYHPLTDDQCKLLNIRPGARAIGVKVHETLVAPEENEAVRRARSFYKPAGVAGYEPVSLDVQISRDAEHRRRIADEERRRAETRTADQVHRDREMRQLLRMQLDLFDRSRKNKLDTTGVPVEDRTALTHHSLDPTKSYVSAYMPSKYRLLDSGPRSTSVDLHDLGPSLRTSSLPPKPSSKELDKIDAEFGKRKGRAKPPSFAAKLRPKKIEAGGTIRFHCSVIGTPDPKIEWYKGNTKITNDDKHYISNNFGLLSLEIRKASKEDEGMYSIKATNSEGEVACTASLQVEDVEKKEAKDTKSAPQFIRDVRHTMADVGSRVVMEALALGHPTPEFRWHKESALVKEDGRIRIQSSDTGTTKLTIKQVAPEDQGVYFVTAENELGRAKCGANLTVLDKAAQLKKGIQYNTDYVEYEPDTKPSFEPKEEKGTRPKFIKDLQETACVPEGENVNLSCVIDGDPKPTVVWYKGTRELTYSRRHRVVADGDKYMLEITGTMPIDSGDYLVVAKNKMGRVQGLCMVTVGPPADSLEPREDFIRPETAESQEAPPLRTSKRKKAPEFVKKLPTSTTVSEGDSVKIEVEVKEDKPAISKVKVKEHKEEKKPEKPSFRRKLNDLIVQEGEPIHFQVDVRGTPEPTINWYLNDEKIVDTSLFQFLAGAHQSALVSDAARPEMSGKLTVKATNESGEVESSVYLIVEVPEPKDGTRPGFSSDLADLNLKQGDKASLEVAVTGDPMPMVIWYKDGERIVDTKVYKFLAGGGKVALQIAKATPDMQGKYTARAVNKNGSAEVNCNVKVKITDGSSRPKFTKPLPDLTVKEGDKITLEVKMSGDPTPLPTWFKDGEQIIDTSIYQFEAGEGKCSLIVNKAGPEHEGEYTVKATNRNGSAECSAVLAVEPPVRSEKPAQEEVVLKEELTLKESAPSTETAPPPSKPADDLPVVEVTEVLSDKAAQEEIPLIQVTQISEEHVPPAEQKVTVEEQQVPAEKGVAPTFLTSLEDLKVTAKAVAKMRVKVQATPEAKVTWYRGEEELKDGGRREIFADNDNFNLEIYDTEVGDSGIYKVVATNDTGSVTCQCQLTVEAVEEGPVFKQTLTDITVKEGEPVRFDCEVEGDDIAVVWAKDGKKVKSGENIKKKHKGNTFSLLLAAAQKSDEGKYTATASDANDMTKASTASLTVEVPEKKKKKVKPGKEEKEKKETEAEIEKPEKKEKKKEPEPEPDKTEKKKKKKTVEEAPAEPDVNSL